MLKAPGLTVIVRALAPSKSRVEVEGVSLSASPLHDRSGHADMSVRGFTKLVFDQRIQGGILADGLAGLLSALGTVSPMSIFAQVSPTQTYLSLAYTDIPFSSWPSDRTTE